MLPQGTSLINTKYFDDLTDQINRIDGCAELQALVSTITADMQAQINSLGQQITILAPLIIVPGSLGGVITWISNFVNSIMPTYLAAIATITQTIAAVEKLTAALENAASRITHCSITVNPLTPPPIYVSVTTPQPPA